jgi:Zn-dependent protease
MTAYQLGRITLNPLKHIDPFLTVLLPAVMWFASGGQFVFGAAKPVPVNPRNYRNYRRGDIIVSGAGIVVWALPSMRWRRHSPCSSERCSGRCG